MHRFVLATLGVLLAGAWLLVGAEPVSHSVPNEQRQRQLWFGDALSAYAVAGCLPAVPSSSLTFAAFACEGYVQDTTTRELLYVTQPAHTLGPLSNSAGTYWLALHRDTTTAVGGWTRIAQTHYLWQANASMPLAPTGAMLFASVTVAGNVITAVADRRRPASYVKAGVYDVTDPLYGAVGDDSTDDTPAFAGAIAAGTGRRIFIPTPRVAYKVGQQLTIPANTQLVGTGKYAAKLHHAFHGDMMVLHDGVMLEGLYLEGDGDTYTGGALRLQDTDGRQIIEHVKIVNFQGPIMDIALAAGSQMSVHDIEMSRWDIATHAQAATGSELYAVVISSTQQLAAVPRKFSSIESNGSPAFNFGGANGVFVSNGFVGDLRFEPESRGVHIVNIRWANQNTAHLQGHNNTITGSGIAPQLVVDSGSDDWGIDCSNSLNIPVIVDNSGITTNRLCHPLVLFTSQVTWSATAGPAPTLGNGDLRAIYSQNGTKIHLVYEITFGSTSTYGDSGAWYFNAPFAYIGLTGYPQVQVGMGYARQAAGNVQTLLPHIISGTNQVYLNLVGGGQANYNSPWAWGAGDIVRFTLDYDR